MTTTLYVLLTGRRTKVWNDYILATLRDPINGVARYALNILIHLRSRPVSHFRFRAFKIVRVNVFRNFTDTDSFLRNNINGHPIIDDSIIVKYEHVTDFFLLELFLQILKNTLKPTSVQV